MTLETVLKVIADVVGWGYFFSWTVSFFPQIYENFRRKSVVGFSFDMVAYFMISYVNYLIYNTVVFFDVHIQEEIMGGSHQSNPVKLADIVFAVVAFICTAIQCLQCFCFERGSQKVHIITWVVCGVVILTLGVLSLLAAFTNFISWVFVLNFCGYVKSAVSFGTYAPQVWLNYRRKSTEGFHIGGVLLDFNGGALSLLQMDIYCIIEHSNKQLTGNIPKMALSLETLIFNIILIIQHYIVYMGSNPVPELHPTSTAEEKQLLIGSSSSTKNIYHAINVDVENTDDILNPGSSSAPQKVNMTHTQKSEK